MTIINDTKEFREGFNTVCNAVKLTLGAEGKLAVLENDNSIGMPRVTKDGVSVARHITEDNRVKLQGNLLAKQCAMKTLADVGDNTTTTLVLAQAMLNSIKTEDFNKKVEKGFNNAYEETQKYLTKLSKKPSKSTISSVAIVASNNDASIGKVVAEAYLSAGGEKGFIDYEKNRRLQGIKLQVTDGFKIESGMFSPICMNDQQKAVFDTAKTERETVILAYEGYEAHDSQEVKDFINEHYKTHNIILVLERVGHPQYFFEKVKAISNNGGAMLVVEATRPTESERERVLKDIALYTGGEVFIQGVSKTIKCGKIDKVRSDLNTTYFIQKNPSEEVAQEIEAINERLNTITALEDPNGSQINFLEYRRRLLGGKTVVIQVGGANEIEIGEVADRVDDAIRAVESISSGGWLVGGGSSFAHIYGKLNTVFDNADIQKGYDAFKESILAPMKQICINSRREKEFQTYLQSSIAEYGVGYNGTTDEVSNLIKDRIIDSKKGLSSALTNAKSTAVLMLNVDVISIITNAPLL